MGEEGWKLARKIMEEPHTFIIIGRYKCGTPMFWPVRLPSKVQGA